ncbi:hypothetical protein ACH5RR_032058 [Cinchona calisaya]|uniref:Uncharacterized protein n=1 Tax=Cinchona calisaya TaxID=153742 RepID=A0ABD2YH14_9GENT
MKMDVENPKREPVEEVVEALLDYLVAPLLPLKPQLTELPSLSQQQSVAKQVHAVVLLYNYYHRKLQPQFKFLNFASFCKLVVVLKPALIAYMKLMHLEKYSEVDDLENQLSLTEKAIMDACDISKALDALKDVPATKQWPITKVAVLLVDSKRENCLLLHSAATDGVWSAIEKDLDVCKMNSEGTRAGILASKRKRASKKSLTDSQSTDHTKCHQLAMLAVKEVEDVNQTDVAILESHVVYSLSKEKAAAYFYVMQSTQSTKVDLQVPIIDVITSLQGPLVKKSSCGWMVTPVVEYFHLLPYAGILSGWISKGFPVAGSINNVDIQSLEEIKINEHQISCLPNHSGGQHDREVDGLLVCGSQTKGTDVDGLLVCGSQTTGTGQTCDNLTKIQHQLGNISSPDSNMCASTVGMSEVFVDDSEKLCAKGCRDERIGSGNKISTIASSVKGDDRKGDCATLPSESKSQYTENLLDTSSSKENASSDYALRTLLRKQEELSNQMHDVDHKIALCDKSIQIILEGGEKSLDLKIDTILEGCNDACLKLAADHDRKDFQGKVSSQHLSEAILSQQNPCQQLDDICHKNIWILPTYHVYSSDGGFRSHVTVKGVDFEISCESEIRSSPQEARMSASLNMIASLQNIASQI